MLKENVHLMSIFVWIKTNDSFKDRSIIYERNNRTVESFKRMGTSSFWRKFTFLMISHIIFYETSKKKNKTFSKGKDRIVLFPWKSLSLSRRILGSGCGGRSDRFLIILIWNHMFKILLFQYIVNNIHTLNVRLRFNAGCSLKSLLKLSDWTKLRPEWSGDSNENSVAETLKTSAVFEKMFRIPVACVRKTTTKRPTNILRF